MHETPEQGRNCLFLISAPVIGSASNVNPSSIEVAYRASFEVSGGRPTCSMADDGAGADLRLVRLPEPQTLLPKRETCVVGQCPGPDWKREMYCSRCCCWMDWRNAIYRSLIFASWGLASISTCARMMWMLTWALSRTAVGVVAVVVVFVGEGSSWDGGSHQRIDHRCVDGPCR